MNKILAGVAIAAVLGVAGYLYLSRASTADLPPAPSPLAGKETKHFSVKIEKGSWAFSPNVIDVRQGDHVIITVVNQDNLDHGFAVDAFGISQRVSAGESITVEFDASQTGTFDIYCSIPCGEGIVNGQKRTHFDMVGAIRVAGS